MALNIFDASMEVIWTATAIKVVKENKGYSIYFCYGNRWIKNTGFKSMSDIILCLEDNISLNIEQREELFEIGKLYDNPENL